MTSCCPGAGSRSGRPARPRRRRRPRGRRLVARGRATAGRARRRQVQPGRRRHRRRHGQRAADRRPAARGPARTTGCWGRRARRAPGTSGVRWVVDPIDGTVNFLYDLPGLRGVDRRRGRRRRGGRRGAQRGHRGAVHRHRRAAAHLASPRPAGAGPTDRQPPAVAGADPGRHRLRLPASSSAGRRAPSSPQLLPRVRDIRRFGSAALDLCAAAAGRIDAYYELDLNPWDHAAGRPRGGRGGAGGHRAARPPVRRADGDRRGAVDRRRRSSTCWPSSTPLRPRLSRRRQRSRRARAPPRPGPAWPAS